MPPKFTSPPNPHAFNAQVWELVRQIPPGRVATYGQVAIMIQPPEGMDPEDYKVFGARWVGGAMAKSPPGVPWQRVINAQGRISLRKGRGYETQRELLEAEGIEFNEGGRVDLARFGWGGTFQDSQTSFL
jgi:methylated-DNA-protein-cysteine methyltransferase related protein